MYFVDWTWLNIFHVESCAWLAQHKKDLTHEAHNEWDLDAIWLHSKFKYVTIVSGILELL